MSVVIRDVLAATEMGSRICFEHGGRLLEAELAEAPERARLRIDQVTDVEIGYRTVTAWQRTPAYPRDLAGLFPAGPGKTRVVGEVHSVFDVGNSLRIYNFYVSSGPEYLAFNAAELDERGLEVGAALEVIVEGLRLYLTEV